MESVQYKLTAINIPCKLLKFPAPQENFHGHMKDHINEKLAPNEFYQFYYNGNISVGCVSVRIALDKGYNSDDGKSH